MAHPAFVRHGATAEATLRGVRVLRFARRFRAAIVLLFASVWHSGAWAQLSTTPFDSQTCPPVACSVGAVIPAGCSCVADDKDVKPPPPLKPPDGCDPNAIKKQLGTATGTLQFLTAPPECKMTPDQCEALPGRVVVSFQDGSSVCAPKKCSKTCYQLKTPWFTPNVDICSTCLSFPIEPKKSVDPNEKRGPIGVSAAQFVPADTPISYVIHFENLPAASAAAQVVEVIDQLDSLLVDLDTFRLGPISFGTNTLVPSPGVKAWSGSVDLRPGQDLIVTVRAALDDSTGQVKWTFVSVDPNTGQLTDDPNAGFLPPNVSPPAGEGSVAFSVSPRPGLATGTQIHNFARIVFDVNAPLDTPQWLSTIDADKPASTVASLAPIQGASQFGVSWSAADSGSGVAAYTLYVSENGGPFTPFLVETPNASTAFKGQDGSSYAFYVVAVDGVGNVQDTPVAAQATTRVQVGYQPPIGDLAFTPLAPCRLVDTRASGGALGPRSGLSYSAGDNARIQQAGGNGGGCEVPGEALALALTITAVGPAQVGNLVLYPAGMSVPLASALNFLGGQIIANTTIVPATAGTDNFSVFNNSDGSTHFVVDVVGYFSQYASPTCQKVSNSAVVAAGAIGNVVAACAAGHGPVGGGCTAGAANAVSWLDRRSTLAGDGYYCSARNDSGAGVTVTTETMCCLQAGR